MSKSNIIPCEVERTKARMPKVSLLEHPKIRAPKFYLWITGQIDQPHIRSQKRMLSILEMRQTVFDDRLLYLAYLGRIIYGLSGKSLQR